MADLNEIDNSQSSITDDICKTYRLPWSKYDNIFKIIDLKEDFETYQKFNVRCKYCVSSKLLTADIRTSSNLLKHLEMQHKNIWTSQNEQSIQTKLKRKTDDCINENFHSNHGLEMNEKKTKVKSILDFSKRNSSVSQNELNLMIQNMIINASLPFNLVEQIDFKNLITTGYPNRHVLSRKTLMNNIETQHQVLLQNMKSIFSKVNYLTTTADCWTIFKRSYLGMTCHWINPISLERESCLLAIRRLKGSHTYDLLARTMESIYTEFNINDKVIYTTTDNGSNFVKCFEMFGQSSGVEIVQDGSKKTDVEILQILEDSIEEEYDKTKKILTMMLIVKKMKICASHTLNLIATADIEKASMLNYKKQSRLTFSKCQALWNKQNRSSQIADTIIMNLGVYLKTPNQTRWNCWFDSLKFLLLHFKNSSSKFTKVCDALKLNRFSKNDIEFLEEYVIVMEPLCICLDVL
ncbi:hypothetical protein AGLY_017832 [Aphis glycines]|uniref:BED-type domain-containing protein n=1 Tax=Aphis glycines TaxID=307491 RepID=A0A6G0SVP7_APHGL|nr:hypothetical protein AGLY_017832 [Aphis glycines]